MPTAGDTVSITGRTTDTQGRFLVTARSNHVVSDARTGPAEAVQAGELLLSALASCSLSNIELHAQERASGLPGGQVHISYERDPQDPTRYVCIRLGLLLSGVTQEEAETLAGLFADSCPIYNTLRRGGNVVIAVRAEAPADRDHRAGEER
ncbi:OsmC family peroxiredoxin [Streptomyces sp. SID8382]|uniref:OsmC family protein n=1 Tax=Streptomyces malaysiensis TaxID=92644 RepID=UPI000C2C5C5E|nr:MULTISPECIES: OsmC family protein [unclassified Streptomyces]AUA16704.1 OsmC-like protein [Streptomyces sp. M56]MYX63279.1 OsmC family peroxiredoxin [Streptomyces sp. SID8382]